MKTGMITSFIFDLPGRLRHAAALHITHEDNTMYDFFEDPGHGWLKVSIYELLRLGIENEISGFSYYKDKYAYLEEDCDMSVFIKAKQQEDMFFSFQDTDTIRRHHTNNNSEIRHYLSYNNRPKLWYETFHNEVKNHGAAT